MPEIFEGIYYDGKTPQPYTAQVRLEPSALHITYLAQDKTLPVNIYWQVHRVQNKIVTPAGHTQLHYGSNPTQLLEIASSDFLVNMEAYYQPQPAYANANPLGRSRIPVWFWIVLFLLLALVPITYFWLLPAFASFVAYRIPAKYEQTLGQALHKQLMEYEKIDSAKTTYLQGFARQLRFQSVYPIQITVVLKNEPNAYAVPGGNIVVQTGILKIIKKPDELAALLAHEYGHLKLRHTTRTLFRNLSGYLFISLLFGDIGGITAILVENANSLKTLQFSRQLETEADELGLQVLLHQHLDPYGMVRLFNQLRAQQEAEPVEFLSTHPALRSRQAHLQQLLKNKKFTVTPHDSLQYYWQKLKAISN